MDSLKFLAFADLHNHNYSQFATVLPGGINSRLADCLSILEQIKSYGEKEKILKVLFLGDLFNSRSKVAIDVYCMVYDMLEEFYHAGFELFFIVGNHDQCLKSGEFHSIRPLSGTVSMVIDRPRYISALGVYAVPYVDGLEDRRISIKAGLNTKATMLAVHTPVSGAKVGPAELALGAELKLTDLQSDKYKLVLLGHYHRAQKLAENVFYLGSPLQLNLGERNDGLKGFWEVDTEDYSMKQIPTKYPKFVEITENWTMEEVLGNFVKLMLRADTQEKDSLKLKTRIEKAARIVVVEKLREEKTQKRLDIEPGMSFEEMLEKFVQGSETELDKSRLVKMGTSFLKEEADEQKHHESGRLRQGS